MALVRCLIFLGLIMFVLSIYPSLSTYLSIYLSIDLCVCVCVCVSSPRYWLAVYYGSVEGIPCMLVLFILRKLPPPRMSSSNPGSGVYQYHRVPDYDPEAYKVKLDVN